MAVLAFVMFNEWSNILMVVGLVIVGLRQGALVTLLFNVLVTSSPKERADDVNAMRGTVNNLSAGVGTAIAGALVVGTCRRTSNRRSSTIRSFRRAGSPRWI